MINDLEKDLLQIILTNEPLLKVIKKVINERIEMERPEVKEGQDNALIGEKYRAYEQSREILEGGFIDLLSYKDYKKNIKSFNKER